jgi:hypothetical protein
MGARLGLLEVESEGRIIAAVDLPRILHVDKAVALSRMV